MSDQVKKSKTSSLLFGLPIACVFVGLGIKLYLDGINQPANEYATFIKYVGIGNIVFFGGLILLVLIKLIRDRSRNRNV